MTEAERIKELEARVRELERACKMFVDYDDANGADGVGISALDISYNRANRAIRKALAKSEANRR